MSSVFRTLFLLFLMSSFISCSSVKNEEKSNIDKGEAVTIKTEETTDEDVMKQIFKSVDDNQKREEYEKKIRNAPEGSPDARYHEIKRIHISGHENAYELNNLHKFTELEEIVLYAFNDLHLPDDITKLKKLKKLNLRSVTFASPNEFHKIGKLNTLEELEMSQVKNIDFLFTMSDMIGLKKIKISDINLNIFPEEVTEIANLEELRIGWTKINRISKNIYKLKKLRVINFSNNYLKELPDTIVMLPNLEILSLTHNEFEFIPSIVGSLVSLVELNCSENKKLSELKFSFDKLKKLKFLYISHSNISVIPESIGYAENLRKIDLKANKIEKIPYSMRLLINLEYLDLSYNLIGNNDISMLGSLKNLEVLALGRSNIPSENYKNLKSKLPKLKNK